MPANKKINNSIPPEDAIESSVGDNVSFTALDMGIDIQKGIETIVFNSAKRDIPEGVLLSSELNAGMSIKVEDNSQDKGHEHGDD